MANYPMLSHEGAPTDGRDAIKAINDSGTVSGGTWQLTISGQQVTDIPWNASIAALQGLIDAVLDPVFGPGACVVDGGPLPTGETVLQFYKNLGGMPVTVTLEDDNLTGTNPVLAVTDSIVGVVGTFRGAQPNCILQDITNGILYRNTGTRATPAWSVPAAEPVWVLTP